MAVDGSKLLDRDIGISKGAHITASQVKGLKIVNVKLKDVSGNLIFDISTNKKEQEDLDNGIVTNLFEKGEK